MQNEKLTRRRRNDKDIENDVFRATETLVSEKGFSNVPFTEIMKMAEVEPSVMYHRFKSIDDLYDKFIRQYDYWFHDLIDFNTDHGNPEKSMKDVLNGLVNSLYDNVIMQKILVWELSDRNKLTMRTAVNREIHSKPLLDFFRNNLKSDIDFDVLTAILIGGIYYLTLHKEISSFCEINFKDEDGKIKLIYTIEQIIDKVYNAESDKKLSKKKIAISLLEDNVEVNIICRATGLSIKEVEKLEKKL